MQPLGSGGGLVGHEEVPTERGNETDGDLGVVDRQCVIDGGGDVGPLHSQPGEPSTLVVPEQAAFRRGDEAGEVSGVAVAEPLGLT